MEKKPNHIKDREGRNPFPSNLYSPGEEALAFAVLHKPLYSSRVRQESSDASGSGMLNIASETKG